MSPALLPGKLSAEVLPCAILELETGCGRVENTPRLVVVASANKWQVISGEKGRAPPDREGQGGKSAVGFPHLTNRKMTNKKVEVADRPSHHLNRTQPGFSGVLTAPASKCKHHCKNIKKGDLKEIPFKTWHHPVQCLRPACMIMTSVISMISKYDLHISSPFEQLEFCLESPLQGGLRQLLTRCLATLDVVWLLLFVRSPEDV